MLSLATQSYQWYSWGPPNMQCRLCASCWTYWKKYGGLKMPTRLDGERPGPNRNNLVGISKKGYLVILSGKLGDVICNQLYTVLKYLRKRMPSTSVVLEFVFFITCKSWHVSFSSMQFVVKYHPRGKKNPHYLFSKVAIRCMG